MPSPEPTEPSAPKRDTIDPSVGQNQRTGAAAGAAGRWAVEDRVFGLPDGRAAGGGVERAAGAVVEGEDRVEVEARGGAGVEVAGAGAGAAAT